jgi:Cdc25 family phosphatase
MSNLTISDLTFITREELANQLSSSSSTSTSTSTTSSSSSQPTIPSNIAIIDVRDSDYVGGHIRGSTHVPSSQLDYKTPELIRTLKDKEVVVFHCALSQQRGPSAALRYLREKGRLDGGSGVVSKGEVKEGGEGEGDVKEEEGKKEQKVVVLKGGFTEWQEKFGEDERLTEGYQKDIWEFGQ